MKENKIPEYPRTKLLPESFHCLLIILDQITKIVAVHFLGGGQKVILIPGPGIHADPATAGRLFESFRSLLFFIITPPALVMIFFYPVPTPSARRYLPMRLCLYFIAAGAVGNPDRQGCFSYVRDSFIFPIDFPVFNVATSISMCCFYHGSPHHVLLQGRERFLFPLI